jgi:hypothetical protein
MTHTDAGQSASSVVMMLTPVSILLTMGSPMTFTSFWPIFTQVSPSTEKANLATSASDNSLRM